MAKAWSHELVHWCCMMTENIFLLITSMVAIMSVTGSLLVVLTFIVFPKMRRRMLMKMIAYISLADFFSNIGYVPLSRPPNGTPLCTIQGFFNLTTYPMSWLWTLAVVYSLYYLAHYSRTPSNGNMLILHLTCWGIPIVLTCISLGFSKLGRQDTYPVFEVCNYYGGLAAETYHIVTYYGLLLLVFGIMIYLQKNIFLLEQVNDPRIFIATYNIAKTSLSLYPTVLLICWFPHGLVSIVEYFDTSTSSAYKEAYFVTDMLKIMHGFLTATLFFYRSSESRRAWGDLLFLRKFEITNGDNVSIIDDDALSMGSDHGGSLDGYRDFSFFISRGISNQSGIRNDTIEPL